MVSECACVRVCKALGSEIHKTVGTSAQADDTKKTRECKDGVCYMHQFIKK